MFIFQVNRKTFQGSSHPQNLLKYPYRFNVILVSFIFLIYVALDATQSYAMLILLYYHTVQRKDYWVGHLQYFSHFVNILNQDAQAMKQLLAIANNVLLKTTHDDQGDSLQIISILMFLYLSSNSNWCVRFFIWSVTDEVGDKKVPVWRYVKWGDTIMLLTNSLEDSLELFHSFEWGALLVRFLDMDQSHYVLRLITVLCRSGMIYAF